MAKEYDIKEEESDGIHEPRLGTCGEEQEQAALSHSPLRFADHNSCYTPAEERDTTQNQSRPFQCPDCDKRFKFPASLQRHLRIHTGVDLHNCSQCGKTFTLPTYLEIHLRTHAGTRLSPYECSQCEKPFARLRDLRMHQNKLNDVKPIHCPLLREGVQSHHVHQVPPRETSGRDAACVLPLREVVQQRDAPSGPPEDSHWGEAVSVLDVWRSFYPSVAAHHPREDAHGREALQVLPVRPDVPTQVGAEDSQEHARGPAGPTALPLCGVR
ncbi:zinc finger protein 878-like [Clupea harengus]|uniref:Zinc finger protein 878-like n=1 Tax=Clupea harengus TaxID=7950 RepID=A0A8M1KBW6_CLUHA|nr:zinc finger protein 878-like [Clupea harengus]